MSSFPRFTYFPEPTESFRETSEECSCCGQVRGWEYKWNVYCMGEKPKHVCPWCIADGSLSEKYADERGRKALLVDTVYEIVRDTDGVITGVQPDFLPGCTVPADLQAEVTYLTPAFLT